MIKSTNHSHQHDICIVGLKCYDLLARNPVPKYLGGIERILVAFARSLVASGVRVAFVTFDEGQPDIETLEGITVIKAHDAQAGLPLLRLVHPRMTYIWKAMRKADAPLYLNMGAGVEAFAVAQGVRFLPKARFVYCTASNMDCEAELSGIYVQHEKFLYRRALEQVDLLTCQTQVQADMMADNYGLSADVIPMPSEAIGDSKTVTKLHSVPVKKANDELNFIWVGRTVEVKRIEWYLDVAERFPQGHFHIVGSANQDSEYAKTQVERAMALSNVTVHGRVSDEALFELYQSADALCCTSVVEGFPTTFLEAWKIGLPIVTTFDPDNIVADNKVGFSVNSVDEFVKSLQKLSTDAASYENMSRAGLELYRTRFSPQSTVTRYIELLDLATTQSPPSLKKHS